MDESVFGGLGVTETLILCQSIEPWMVKVGNRGVSLSRQRLQSWLPLTLRRWSYDESARGKPVQHFRTGGWREDPADKSSAGAKHEFEVQRTNGTRLFAPTGRDILA